MLTPTRRMLIINFNGIGNGIFILPMLKRLEEVAKNHYYFHIHNPVFDVFDFMDWLGLKNFLGTVPESWRRFALDDWDVIKDFLCSNEINIIVNLRNEGPARDVGYFQFKQEMARSDIEFWELDHTCIESRPVHQHLIEDQVNLFESHGINLPPLNRLWLHEYVMARSRSRLPQAEIGFFTGASQSVKTWPASEWIALGRIILERTNFGIVVYAGQTGAELEMAHSIVSHLQHEFASKHCVLVVGQTLDSLCAHLSGLDLLISNDTSCIHMAAALDVPTVGLYFSTDSTIWGGFNDKFTQVQSRFGLECPSFKRDAGNCSFYYGGCPGPCKDEVTPQRVFQAIEKYIPSVNFDPVESLIGSAFNK